MNNYAESKKTLDKIRSKDEIMFRMAISHLMDVGIRHLTEENILRTCSSIVKRDDSKAFMTNEYMCDLVVMAGDIAQVPHTDLLVYIQREVDYDVFDGGILYSRAIKLLKNCIDWFADDCCDREEILERLKLIDLEEEDLEALGYGYLLNTFYEREEE